MYSFTQYIIMSLPIRVRRRIIVLGSILVVLVGIVLATLWVLDAPAYRVATPEAALVDEQDRPIDPPGISEGRYLYGSQDSDVVIHVWTDYECPYCRKFDETLLLVERVYSEDQLGIAIHAFPLNEIHPMALRAAAFANCAGDQGQFREAHLAMFKGVMASSFDRIEGELGLKPVIMDYCVAAETQRIITRKEKMSGVISGTPSWQIMGSSNTPVWKSGYVGLVELSALVEDALTS